MIERSWVRLLDCLSDNLKSKTQNRKWVGYRLAILAILAGWGGIVEAQQPKNVPRIGYLSRDLHPADSRAPLPHNHEAFRQGLRELGYIEGKNIIIDYRYADGRFERLPALAEELVRLKIEIIVADSIASARAAKNVTSTIPVVMASVGDPIVAGLVASLARPGGNLTGTTDYSAGLLGKRLQLLKEVVPKVSRFAFLNDVSSAASKPMFKDGQVAAQALGVKLELIEVKNPDPDFDGAFRIMTKQRISSSLHRKRFWS